MEVGGWELLVLYYGKTEARELEDLNLVYQEIGSISPGLNVFGSKYERLDCDPKVPANCSIL